MTLTFAEDTHTYTVDGVVIPSVTQILEYLRIGGNADGKVPAHIWRRAQERGTAVHIATQYLDEDDLVLDSIDPELAGYVLSYQRAKEKYEISPERIEYRMFGEIDGMRYGMTIDRVAMLTYRGNRKRFILDLKTSEETGDSWVLQTAAYEIGYGDIDHRAVIKLFKDGTPGELLLHDRPEDYKVWEAALRLAYWKLRK